MRLYPIVIKGIILICKHFGKCGSCGWFAMDYTEQLQNKQTRLAQLLAPYYENELELFDSPPSRHRARAEFRIWHEGECCRYAMGNYQKDGAVCIEECPKVISAIQKRMWKLLERINASSQTLGHRLFGVEFLATTSDECLITMLYHKKLDEAWSAEAKLLEQELNCKILGRSRKQKVVLDDEFVTETLRIGGKQFTYRQYEGGFTQPNPSVNIKMIEWAIRQAKSVNYGDFLESYCGLGNFTLPLAGYFKKVLATEISKRSIQAALENCRLNNIANITFARLSSEEMTEALTQERTFNRLKEIELHTYDFSTVLVDPPRAGLDEGTTTLISKIDHIIYISCNPETLARDLKVLTQTHQVAQAALFDQFPYTEHIESGVFLVKKA